MFCSRAIRVIQRSDLMDMCRVRSASEEGQQQREQDTQDDGGGQRKIETETPPPHVEISGQPPQRHAEHHHHAEGGDAEADEHKALTQARGSNSPPRWTRWTRPDSLFLETFWTSVSAESSVVKRLGSVQTLQRSTQSHTPRYPARRIRASRCARSTGRTPSAS